jgi:hypothetical protein
MLVVPAAGETDPVGAGRLVGGDGNTQITIPMSDASEPTGIGPRHTPSDAIQAGVPLPAPSRDATPGTRVRGRRPHRVQEQSTSESTRHSG